MLTKTPLLHLMVDNGKLMCYACQMFLKKYNFYPNDLGDFVIMDDEYDLMLATCGNQSIASMVVDALNDMELLENTNNTKIH
jgi:hypothetical protein